MNVKEFLRMVYPIINQKGGSIVVGNNWLPILNSALNIFFNYKGYRWFWQTTIQDIPLTQRANGVNFEIKTEYPVIAVHKFFTLPKEACIQNITGVGCSTQVISDPTRQADCCESECGQQCQEGNLTMDCGANEKTGEIPMKLKLPKSPLFCGEYQLPFGVWGYYIRGKLPAKFDKSYKVYVEYFRGFNRLTSYNEELPIPDNLTTALSYAVASLVINPMGQFRSGDSLYYYNLFKEAMEDAYEQQMTIPKEVTMSAF